MNYGYLFSSELQKMAYGFKPMVQGVTRRAPTYNEASGVPETGLIDPRVHGQPSAGVGRSGIGAPVASKESPAWYQASNAAPQWDMNAENMGITPPKKDAQYFANAMRADYAKKPNLGGVPNTQFNPPKAPSFTTQAPQQQDQNQFRNQRSTAGAGPGGRFASPQR